MVNFRFHVVSILAIFLAIAIGTVMGAAFVGRGVVDGLQTRIDTVDRNRKEVESTNRTLVTEVSQLQRYVDQSAPTTVQNRLTGVRVDVVAERGIDGNLVDAQVGLLRAAGATVPGVIWLEEAWQVAEQGQAADLRQATGLTQRSTVALRRAAAGVLGARLASPPTTVDADPLELLAGASFITLAGAAGGSEPTAADYPGSAGRLLVLGGPQSVVPAKVAEVIAAGAVDLGVPVVVGQVFDPSDDETGRSTWIDEIAEADALRGRISTVDDAERTEGRVAATLALAEAGSGEVGRYGIDQEQSVPTDLPVVPSAR